MKDDARDSLGEFQSSIFDASDGHQLVDFIRKKKGLQSQPQKIFDDIGTDRQSLQIEIQRLDEDENTLQPENAENEAPVVLENEVHSTSTQNTNPNICRSPRKLLIKSPGLRESKIKLKRLSHSIGRRTLLKEFERTLQESRFVPTTCSTPLNVNDKDLAKAPSTVKEKSKLSLNVVCTPITITDDDSPLQSVPKDHSEGRNQTLTANNNNTEDVMRDLQEQNDMLLELANSDEELLNFGRTTPPDEQQDAESNNENTPNSIVELPGNRTSTPIKTNQRRTFTVHRDSTSGKLILSPNGIITDENVRQPMPPSSPVRNVKIDTKKLVVTPEQKRLLLSKFGRNSAEISSLQKSVNSAQKSSRIPVIMKSTTIHAPLKESQSAEATNHTYHIPENTETAHIIEQLQKTGPTNAPVIVIPVNQTFNQAPMDTNGTAARVRTYMRSPNTNEISSTTTITTPIPAPVVKPSNDKVPINSLRFEDIITDDDSGDSDDNQPIKEVRLLRNGKKIKSSNTSTKPLQEQDLLTCSNKGHNPQEKPKRSTNYRIREVMKQHQLSQLSENEILDLRKRNSRGELQVTMKLSKRESSMFGKQIEIELLRRSMQENNCEDEVLQMEVLPPPPDEFCDNRNSLQDQKSLQFNAPAIGNDLFDENISDRISLSQDRPQEKLPKSHAGPKRRISRQKVSEQVEKYLKVSEMVPKSKYLNLSKRKLYNKGESDSESSPQTSRSHRRTNTKDKLSKSDRKTNERVPIHKNDTDKIPGPPVSPTRLPPSPPPLSSPNRHVRSSSRQLRSSVHLSPTPLNPPADLANQSKAKTLFIQNDREIFKKPCGRPLKKRPAGEKSNTVRSRRSPSPPPAPVDPDEEDYVISNRDEGSALRRSKRGRRPLTAYWSCTQKEYCPLYDVNRLLPMKKGLPTTKKKTETNKRDKNLPRNDDNLVANTKPHKSNSVPKSQKKKGSTKKQQQEPEPKQAKRRGKKSQQLSDIDTNSNDNVPSSSGVVVRRPTNASEDPAPVIDNYDSDDSNIETTRQEILRENITVSSDQVPSEDPNLQRHRRKSTTVEPINFKIKGRKSKKEKSLPDSKQCEDHPPQPADVDRTEKPTTSKSRGAKSKHARSPTPSSDCPSEDDPPSIQQVCLTAITEDTACELGQQATICVSDLDKENRPRLSAALMPPPASSVVKKKAKNSKKNNREAFRTGHDESIADVSSVHVNKLFDQLKSSSMCAATDVTAKEASCSGKTLPVSRAKNNSSTVPKCKNLSVRLLRMRNKEASPEGNGKVCDSGFSSEDMSTIQYNSQQSSDRNKGGDILLNWLKEIVRNGKSPPSSETGVARFLLQDGFHAASVDDLIFQEISGVDYAFYNTSEQFKFGYMRFNPKTKKKTCKAEKYELNYVVLCGTVKINVNKNTFDCKNGDLITVFKGTSYGIKNVSNEPALVMVIKN